MQPNRDQTPIAPFRSGGNLNNGSSAGSAYANLNNDFGNMNWNYGARNFAAKCNRRLAAGVITGSRCIPAPHRVNGQNRHGAQGLVGFGANALGCHKVVL